MKVSKKWLQDILSEILILPSSKELVETLTMAGLEVDALEPVANDFSGVVVGEVLSVMAHPDADKLRVCQVQGSQEHSVQVVCGASNVREGIKIPFAETGAVLGEKITIKEAKLRGVVSNGMLCSAEELGLDEHSEGLLELDSMAPVGECIRNYLSLDDEIIDIDLTPNRGDCSNMRGVAREVATLYDKQYLPQAVTSIPEVNESRKEVELSSEQQCPLYVSRVIQNINTSAKAPLWMSERLRRSGIRSVDIIVDITNYVLLELGQPMHAFDYEKIDGAITIRQAKEKESITLLDGQSYDLNNHELVIADKTGPLALAGIMGGLASSITSTTTNIVLEAAFFEPSLIAGKARKLGLQTDSSYRFERGVDYELPRMAIERATALILELVGGEPGVINETHSDTYLPTEKHVLLRRNKIESILGICIEDQRIERILSSLGFTFNEQDLGWSVSVPSWRFDVSIEADLLEEIARVFGYDNLPVHDLFLPAEIHSSSEDKATFTDIANILIHREYQEIISYSFISEKEHQQVHPDITPVKITNPISSDMAVMRTSLWPGLLQTLDYNTKRQQSRLKIFEQGLVFTKDKNNDYHQVKMISGAILGFRYNENWSMNREMFDFYDIKADVNQLLGNKEVTYIPVEHEALHPGQSAQIIDTNGNKIGIVGALHPKLKKERGFSDPVFLFELDYNVVEQIEVSYAIESLSKYPEVRRDISLMLNKTILADHVIQEIKQHGGEHLKEVIFFDQYEGDSIDKELKSIAIGLIFQNKRSTLKEIEVNKVLDKIYSQLTAKFQAAIRD
jgi:phenylalanyl-tRNA synthetase beta chain